MRFADLPFYAHHVMLSCQQTMLCYIALMAKKNGFRAVVREVLSVCSKPMNICLRFSGAKLQKFCHIRKGNFLNGTAFYVFCHKKGVICPQNAWRSRLWRGSSAHKCPWAGSG